MTPEEKWDAAFNEYVMTVRMGGTPAEREWKWSQAMKALGRYMAARERDGLVSA